MNLKDNKIAALAENTFKDLRNLETLYLHNNSLEFIHVNLFRNNPKLNEIYLRVNKIHSLVMTVFRPMSNLNRWVVISNECVNSEIFDGAYKYVDKIESNLKWCTFKYMDESQDKFDETLDQFRMDFEHEFAHLDDKLDEIEDLIDRINRLITEFLRVKKTFNIVFGVSAIFLVIFLVYSLVSGCKTHRQIYFRS